MNEVKFSKFRVDEILTLSSTKGFDKGEVDFINDGVPFIGRSYEKNGMQGRVRSMQVSPNEPYSITASVVGVKYALLQIEEYYCSQNINKLILKNENYSKNKNILFYVTTSLQKTLDKWKGQYGGYLQSELNSSEISLPVSSIGVPDWDYMDNYIKEIKIRKMKEIIESYSHLDRQKYELEDVEFGEFRLGDFFRVDNGRKYPKSVRINGNIPLVSTSSVNRGISDYVEFPEGSGFSTHKNVISIAYSGSVGETFHHPEEVFIGETVMALIPKKFDLSENIANYIVTSLKKSFVGFSYARKMKVSQIRDVWTIELPMTDDESPNWDYMDKYIHNTKIDKINMIISELESEIELLREV